MIYLFIILLSAGIAWGVFILLSRTPSDLPDGKPESQLNKTLDELYAAEKHMWICSRCETINSDHDEFCVACGTVKKR